MLGQREEENIHSSEALLNRRVQHTTSPELNETSAPLPRESVGGEGMFLQQMQRVGLSVSEFQCVTTEMVEAIVQQLLTALISSVRLTTENSLRDRSQAASSGKRTTICKAATQRKRSLAPPLTARDSDSVMTW